MPYINIHDGTTHTLNSPSMMALAQTFERVFPSTFGIPNPRVWRPMALQG